jgi:hypothetical protein
MENHYYDVVYDILRGPRDLQDKEIGLKMTKGKIVRLNIAYYQHIMLVCGQQNNYVEEGPTLYHVIEDGRGGNKELYTPSKLRMDSCL